MRIDEIEVTSYAPITKFAASDLSEAVFIAGPNGVGKTRLLSLIMDHLTRPSVDRNLPVGPDKGVRLRLIATTNQERTSWGKNRLDTSLSDDRKILKRFYPREVSKKSWHSIAIISETDRQLKPVSPRAGSVTSDPYLEPLGIEATTNSANRWSDALETIFRRILYQRERAFDAVETAQRAGRKRIRLDNIPDPLDPFRDAFDNLLHPKKLGRVDRSTGRFFYSNAGHELGIETLSHGEKEALAQVFDFQLRAPQDCIVLYDEPELHLHPELCQRLIKTLKGIGERNQFVFCTHSSHLISSGLNDTVLLFRPPLTDGSNQAVVVDKNDATSLALNHLGHYLGVVSLGKRVVLVEGEEASLDKKVYDAIIRKDFSEFVLVPSAGRKEITNFSSVHKDLLSKSIWGVEFYMLCDHDSGFDEESGGRLRVLSRYHLENYFLDEAVLAATFTQVKIQDPTLRTEKGVYNSIREIARKYATYAVALRVSAVVRKRVGNVDVMPKGVDKVSLDGLDGLFQKKIRDQTSRVSRCDGCNRNYEGGGCRA